MEQINPYDRVMILKPAMTGKFNVFPCANDVGRTAVVQCINGGMFHVEFENDDERANYPREALELLTPPNLIQEIEAERARQKAKWSNDHDDMHDRGELSCAAACLISGDYRIWPWDNTLSEQDCRTDIIRGIALAIAEVERLDRIEANKNP